MLPTKGYFQDIECPFYESSCNRPYCHFRHRKKGTENIEDPVETAKEPEVPTYKPTPKSELANIKSHIPISYVPDLAFRPDRTTRQIPKLSFNKPTYKPTPLSILSSANKKEEDEDKEDIEAIREIKQNIASVEYNPCADYQPSSVEYKQNDPSVEYNPSNVEYKPSNVEYMPEGSPENDINFEDLSAEFDLIDDIIEEPPKSAPIPKNEEVVVTVEEKGENNKEKWKPAKEKGKSKSEKNDKHSSNKSHKSKHHKKDTKEKHKEELKDKHDKGKEKDKRSDKSKESSKHSSHKSKHKSSKERDKRKDKDRDKDKEKRRSEDKDKQRNSSKSKERHKEKKLKEKTPELLSDSEGDVDDYSGTYLEDEDTLTECYKIFSEYEPPKVDMEAVYVPQPVEEVEEDNLFGKKRVAHSSAQNQESGSRIHIQKPKLQPAAAQIMLDRFKLAKLAQANNEQKNIMNEIKSIKRPPPSFLEAAKSYKIQKLSQKSPESITIIDSILNSSKQQRLKKIAPVMNVSSIQRAKAKIEEMAKQKACEAVNKTPAQTVKGAKRVAHVPDVSLSDIPDVLQADKSKLPINVRTRFLTMLADECVKLYLTKEDAYNRALNEEFGCYEKCKVLATYKNSAMLAVNRLRKELQERTRSGLGPIGDGESSDKGKSSDFNGERFYNNIKRYVLTEEELDIHGYPKESHIPGHATIKNRRSKVAINLPENQRKCCRCSKIYLVDDDGFVLYPEECLYHPLKKRTLRGEQTYLCCKSNDDTGCATANTHVTEMGDDAELEGYQTTMDPEPGEDQRSRAVYALDCEMCYTIRGLELTRVTIVDSDCKTVYETLVKPLNPIIDYNTTFSGITKDQMDRTSTNILQVQANILHLCNSKTILIGHSLESDMKALKIIHSTIIDTSVLFPHKMGLPHKRALKMLASEYLKKIIQNNINGHDSAEDAITCMELVKWKVKEELKLKGNK